MPDVQVPVPDSGHLIGDGETLIGLRTAASDVGCTSCEIGDDRGTLSIVLHLPSSSVDEATDAARRFTELAGFRRELVRPLDSD